MSLSATLKKESVDEDGVRYVDTYGGADAFLAGPLVLKLSDLPDPPPPLLRVSLSWYQAPCGADAAVAHADTGRAPASMASVHRKVGQGEVVRIIKSRVSGARNPPEWLGQHLGRTGIVLWTTDGGANVDLDGDAVWFAYDELELKTT